MLRSHNWISIVIPYDNIFNLGPSTNRCTFIQATILALTPHSITLSHVVPELGVGADGVLAFDYAVYAVGSRLPEPLDLWRDSASGDAPGHFDANAINGNAKGKPAILHAPYAYGGTKAKGIAWLKRKQRVVEEAASVLVVGGGALGIRECFFFLLSLYPSRFIPTLLPIDISNSDFRRPPSSIPSHACITSR
jgi:hypothetical protein